jgi:hypothetical protein
VPADLEKLKVMALRFIVSGKGQKLDENPETKNKGGHGNLEYRFVELLGSWPTCYQVGMGCSGNWVQC